jgi:methionyl-tRNA formyltransferase
MKALVLTSNKIRHKYYVQKIAEHMNVIGVITEPKVKYYNNVIEESSLVREHFIKLSLYEEKYLGKPKFPENIDLLELTKDEINSEKALSFAKDKDPDVIFLFGTCILKDNWLDAFPGKIINLHLGLSPFYRGSATLFWPIYNNSLSCLGVTIHITSRKVDAGEIIARIKPNLEEGDDYYDINIKAIKAGIDSMALVTKDYINGNRLPLKQDLSKSNLYRKSDFTEEKLQVALKNIGDGISNKQIKQIENSKECSC